MANRTDYRHMIFLQQSGPLHTAYALLLHPLRIFSCYPSSTTYLCLYPHIKPLSPAKDSHSQINLSTNFFFLSLLFVSQIIIHKLLRIILFPLIITCRYGDYEYVLAFIIIYSFRVHGPCSNMIFSLLFIPYFDCCCLRLFFLS